MKFELGPGVDCDLDSLVDSRVLVPSSMLWLEYAT